MRSIGLTEDKITEQDVSRLCDGILQNYDRMDSVRDDGSGVTFLDISRDLGRGFGLKVIGQRDGGGFRRTSYFPYVTGTTEGSGGSVGIQSQSAGDSYIGVCNDGRIAAPLIFTLQNPGTYLSGKKHDPHTEIRVTTTFSALSLQGRVLLPVRTRLQQMTYAPPAWETERAGMIEQAKMGSEDAIQTLVLENLNLFMTAQQRVEEGEDILSVVDTYCIPQSMQPDHYHVLTHIERVAFLRNSITGEPVWRMELTCGGLPFDLCISQKDLEGYPTAGMRFKGDIWLQGRINYSLPSGVS